MVERWLPKPKVTSSSLAFRSEKTAKVIHLGRFCFTKDGIFCTRKGLRTYIFYPVKQLKIALTGMQNFAHQNSFHLIDNKLAFQVRSYSHT